MAFILDIDPDAPHEERVMRWKEYREYIESIKDRLPTTTYEFATADWHYDANDPKCPHDAWVEELSIRELSREDELQDRWIEIRVHLLSTYHNGHIELLNKKVRTYSVGKRFPVSAKTESDSEDEPGLPDEFFQMLANQGHNDWLVDEIRLSEQGLVLHEIVFWLGHWIIECEELSYQWKPFTQGNSGGKDGH